MKDVRFYLEFPDRKTKKRSGREHKGHSGTVCALFYNNGRNGSGNLEGLAGVFDDPNSPVACTGVNLSQYLWPQCKRISERVARTIHPALFTRLDS